MPMSAAAPATTACDSQAGAGYTAAETAAQPGTDGSAGCLANVKSSGATHAANARDQLTTGPAAAGGGKAQDRDHREAKYEAAGTSEEQPQLAVVKVGCSGLVVLRCTGALPTVSHIAL